MTLEKTTDATDIQARDLEEWSTPTVVQLDIAKTSGGTALDITESPTYRPS